jgi:hypothetical protein
MKISTVKAFKGVHKNILLKINKDYLAFRDIHFSDNQRPLAGELEILKV